MSGLPRAVLALGFAGLLACPGPGPSVDAGLASDGGRDAGDPGGDAGVDFLVPPLLGRPTAVGASVNLVSGRALEVYVEAGPAAGPLQTVVPVQPLAIGVPTALDFTGLPPDAACVWRLHWRAQGATDFQAGPARPFHTQRPPGATFRFTVQADSHMDENSVAEQYARTLGNVATDAPDFHVDLGDTFMCEKHDQPLVAPVIAAADEATVVRRYLYERGNFGVLLGQVPLFLVNGNHDAELGYLATGAGNDLATWATHARQRYFLPPLPGAFYSGDTRSLPWVGERGAFYAFTWGDALFVMLDPFWETMQRASQSGWTMTLGPTQYAWLAQTLRGSTARFKFVFIHNLVGGLDGQQRGGVEGVPYFEWGGRELDGGVTFAQRRPSSAGWQVPIHDLLVETHVTTVFHGHDHLYAYQALDGVVYQEVPQPSARNTLSGPMLAAQYHYDAGTVLSSAGHLRVTVTPTSVTSEYVRSWVPAQVNASRHNAEIAHTWSVP